MHTSVLVTKFDQNRPNGYGAGGQRSERQEETARIQYISRCSTNITTNFRNVLLALCTQDVITSLETLISMLVETQEKAKFVWLLECVSEKTEKR